MLLVLCQAIGVDLLPAAANDLRHLFEANLAVRLPLSLAGRWHRDLLVFDLVLLVAAAFCAAAACTTFLVSCEFLVCSAFLVRSSSVLVCSGLFRIVLWAFFPEDRYS